MTARSRTWVAVWAAGAVAILGTMGTLAATTTVATARATSPNSKTKHVLLISVDGLHQFDLEKFINLHPDSALARLTRAGTQYNNASTSRPSDSFPGLLAPVTGGTPKSTGVFYDDSYSRSAFTPAAQTNTSSQDCSGPPGAETQYAENIDVNAPSTANNQTGTRTILGERIDPTQLPYELINGKCVPVYPNDFLRTNTIFTVAHQAGLATAWTDKHAAYQIVNGHGTPNSVDDLFTPEINADIIPAHIADTRANDISFPFPNPTGNAAGPIITDYVGNTEAYDQIKVDAILNQIDGKTSASDPAKGGTPAIFGMNFQSVSVGQKTVDPTLTCDPKRSVDVTKCDPNYVPGGYVATAQGITFTPQLDGLTTYASGVKTPGALDYVDDALSAMVNELNGRSLYNSTEIVIEAKHGQAPIDPAELARIGHAETTVLNNAGIQPAQVTDDDVALIWLADQSKTTAAVNALQASISNGNPAHIATILHGPQLARLYNDPSGDSHTPDMIVLPTLGTIYSGSHAKVAEHGGFSTDDNHVALVVVNEGGQPGGKVDQAVQTTQIAPTILQALGLDPGALDAVRMEGTAPLPTASAPTPAAF
jgi:hypothetical protein